MLFILVDENIGTIVSEIPLRSADTVVSPPVETTPELVLCSRGAIQRRWAARELPEQLMFCGAGPSPAP